MFEIEVDKEGANCQGENIMKQGSGAGPSCMDEQVVHDELRLA